MQGNEARFARLVDAALARGARNAAVISVDVVETDTAFRDMCAANVCGQYGKCWTCPPDVGTIEEMIARVRSYRHMLVYQTIGVLEDSFDVEGMHEAGTHHNRLAQSMRQVFTEEGIEDALHLGAGGCRVCAVCARRTDEPCRHPELAMTSLEACGINVSRLAPAAGMKYINGQDTVTYFGAVLF